MSETLPVRERIVSAAAALLADRGPHAVTTRGVAEAAGVQAPAIYRLFGDKDGLLDAVAEHVMALQVAAKTRELEASSDQDPVEDLRSSWFAQVEFGLANPAVFRLLSDPARLGRSPAARSGRAVLEARTHRVAAAGRLRVPESRATDLLQAAGLGVIQTLLAAPADARDPGLPEAVYEVVARTVLTDVPARADDRAAVALGFRALVPVLEGFSGAERALLADWVERAIAVTDGARR